ncbi:MAG: hypothetical protein FWE09_04335 [Treponema sp.]|nr:hypothetical protein [Treponema sp.]
MAKKNRGIYEPGELNRVREKLGDIDEDEAKRMARILGGEVGTEKALPPAAAHPGKEKAREKTASDGGWRKKRRAGKTIEGPLEDERFGRSKRKPDKVDPLDDPGKALSPSYFERLKMDRLAANGEFDIKTGMQLLSSYFSFFGRRGDYINPKFTSRKMNDYYVKISDLVRSTRILLPRNDARRSERLKKASPFIFSILDTIRQWNIERIGGELAKFQARPRNVQAAEYADTLRAIYRPIFVLEKLNADTHIRGAYRLLYRMLYLEQSREPREKVQGLVRSALSAYYDIFRDVHYSLYPLLMKLISDRFFSYDKLFVARHRRYMAFIDATEMDQIKPIDFNMDQVEKGSIVLQEEIANEEAEGEEIDENDPEWIARREREAEIEAEKKAVDQSLKALESLFPKAGWDSLREYPDLYPYFASVYGLRSGYELIAPNDPLQQVAILMHIVEDLCSGLRHASFGMVQGPDGNQISLNDSIGKTVLNWRRFIDESFTKEYLPRLSEYCRMLEHSSESRASPYARRAAGDLRWAKRLYFLPYFKFDSMGPPPFQKAGITAIYAEIRVFRRHLSLLAANIEKWNQLGGAASNAECEGLDNPLAHYVFDIANPVSKRLNMLLAPGKRSNVFLIFFALSAVTLLDHLLNNEASWAYDRESTACMFRSVGGEGSVPMFGVNEKVDADKIFKDMIKQAKGKQEAKG